MKTTRNMAALSPLLLVTSGLIYLACTDLGTLEEQAACDNAGYSIANRTAVCTGDYGLANDLFLKLGEEYDCLYKIESLNQPSTGGTWACATKITELSCDQVVTFREDLTQWLGAVDECATTLQRKTGLPDPPERDAAAADHCANLFVNFQPPGGDVPAGYVPDFGDPYGPKANGCSYGWNVSISNQTRVRGVHPDPLYDTLIHIGNDPSTVWEAEVPNGEYTVHLVLGDPSYTDSRYGIIVEESWSVTGTPTEAQKFVEKTSTIVVQDGRITLRNLASAANNKIAFVTITR